jgi:hypothetical protein
MNTPMNPTEQDLNARLARQADRFDRLGGGPLEIGQVLARAGEIRRGRRMRATMVMAAAVLALAVPAALLTLDRGDDEPTPAPPVPDDHSRITLGNYQTGAAPKAGWFEGDVWHGPGGREAEFSGGAVTAVATSGDALLVASSDPQGQRAFRVPPAGDTAQEVKSWPMEGGFGVSDEGHVVAFVQPDGTPVVVQDDGRVYTMTPIPQGTGFDLATVNGEECEEGRYADRETGCSVSVNSAGEKPASWFTNSHGIVDKSWWGFLKVADEVSGGLEVGITEVHDDLTTCSAAHWFDETEGKNPPPRWTTCDHRPLAFSPDGDRLLATTSFADGLGDRQLAILDSDTGKPTLELDTTDDAFIAQMVWEDDSHVLATVYEKGKWAVLRVGLDGSREYAIEPTAGEDTDRPFVLPTR